MIISRVNGWQMEPNQPKDSWIEGTVSEDPEAGIPIGTTLRFQAISFALGDVPRHESVSNGNAFRGVVLALCFPTDCFNKVLGSAVMVAPGVALTAAHVIDECTEEVMTGRFGAMCIGLDGTRMDIWRIRHIAMGPEGASDLSVLSLELASKVPPNGTLYRAGISTRTPSMGEELKLLGFRQNDDPERPGTVRPMDVQMLVSSGPVVEQFPTGRGRALGPCVQVDCHTAGGMSGGPVFDREGMLVGILSKGLDGGPSWVSLLWPALVWETKDGWPLGVMAGARALLDLDPSLIAIEGRLAIARHEGVPRYAQW